MQLEDGDIICFQKAPATDNEEHIRYPDVPSYLEYVHNRQVFSFWGLIKGNLFRLMWSKNEIFKFILSCFVWIILISSSCLC